MACTTSKHSKLYRFLYIEANENYGTPLDITALATVGVGSWKDLKVTTGPSEIAIEMQETTLANYGPSLRDDHTQFAYWKVTGGSVVTPHHANFAANHSGLLGSGFGSYIAGAGSGVLTVAANDTNQLVLDTGEGATFTAGQMIKIGDRIATIESISTDTLSIDHDIPVSATYAIGTSVTELDTWNPQCLQDNKYYHAIIWDANEYWLLEYFKPSFTMNSNDGGVPMQWTMNLSAYSARRLTAATSDVEDVVAATDLDTYTISTLNNKTRVFVQDSEIQDISSVTLEIERDNTRWETGVNANGAVGSINDITSTTGSLTVFTNKDTYHGYVANNTEINIGWQSSDGYFAFNAPAAKLTRSGENPIGDENNQNVAMFGISYNEQQDETLKVYLGDL